MVSARTIALVLVVVGATAFALPTFATEGFSTERPTSFGIGSDNSALIGSSETGNTVKHRDKLSGSGPPTVTVGYLVNNFDSELSLTYRVTSNDGSVTTYPADDSGESQDMTLAAGQTGAIDLQCASGDRGTGTAGVTVTVESAYADGVGVENAEIDFQVQYDCSPPSDGESETISEYCADSSSGEDENENENENENTGDSYTYTYDYDYEYKNGKYRYEYNYDYEWSRSADQNPNPDPSTSPDQSLDCVSGDGNIDISPDPDPDPDPPDNSG